MAILDEEHFEDILYDGLNVYCYNQENGAYENRGNWEEKGKQYIGYSSILYNNIVSTFQEFQKNKASIIYSTENAGYTLKLPPTEDRGEVIMFFAPNAVLPKQILRYTERDNSNDYVSLTLNDTRLNCKFPEKFFHPNFISASKRPEAVSSNDKPSSIVPNSTLLAVGSMAPEWELINSNGIKRKLSDFKGKVVVIDFWATWCAPCVQAQPKLQSIHEAYKDVAVLGMDFNDKKDIDINAYKEKKKLSYEMLLNAENIGNAYQVQGLPTLYVIDRSGKIIYASLGYSEKEEALLDAIIDKATRPGRQ